MEDSERLHTTASISSYPCLSNTSALSTLSSPAIFGTMSLDGEAAALGLSDQTLRFEAPPPATKKRKVAVCITGAFRIFERVKQTYIKYLLEPNEADVFAYGSVESHNAEEMDAFLRLSSLPGFRYGSIRPFDEHAWLRYMQEKHNYPKKHMDRKSWGVFAQWWNYDRCISLLGEYSAKHHLDYSEAVIFKVRPDLRFDVLTNLTAEPTGTNHLHVMLYPGNDHPRWYADYYTYGGFNAMKYISKLYEQVAHFKSSEVHVAEDMLYRFVTANQNLTVSTFPFMGWNIQRAKH
eukprot:GILK01013533.1.p1 GENE.GILK01013533.1~~GILK01013533.1.p1  ORF type:complete len:331 (+),score=34.83 GILK01013533.1:118-993(+)